ncbi:putative dehydrogenase [Catalinimonas alkaloidigena]|uniref:Gfo/Idh/MocA family oxidoreductase n=1 Tax=Catalinimonas alkaloidigena TaxID=1075417 RepID=UPI002405DAD5|nr:Gfo/Idh/MocA family oxidoreductase [Catalinimonas alkaloidigena]MDF9796435.1 putative dehydrogenase [Catalinimonas alkaloidigena]
MSSRRDFIKKAAATTAGVSMALKASSYNRIIGANDRVNLCFMGLGRRVGAYYDGLDKKNNTQLMYLCDVKQSQIDRTMERLKGRIDYKPKQTDDIRKVLEDKEVDAIFIAAPDHWHAPGTIMALDAGKHVYVEKPCAHNPHEEEVMVAKQKSTGKMVQMGNQQRSSNHTIEIINEIHNGVIGKPYRAVAFYNSSRGEVPLQKKQAPPSDLNWDLFQGPAPRQAYHHDTWDYNWHWYGWNWGTAEAGNNGIHELDIGRWALGVDFPEFVHVEASKQHFKDDGWEMYDQMYATFRFDEGKVINWDGKSRNGYSTYGDGKGRGTVIYGSEGTVFVDRSQYMLYDREGKLVKESSKTDESGMALGGGGSTSSQHIVNFFDAIRGQAKLTAPIEDGAKSNHMAMLANIAYRTNKSFDVDSTTGRAYDKDAMQLWSREYESGWEIGQMR